MCSSLSRSSISSGSQHNPFPTDYKRIDKHRKTGRRGAYAKALLLLLWWAGWDSGSHRPRQYRDDVGVTECVAQSHRGLPQL